MPTYEETVRSEMERLEDHELQRRLAAGTLTEEARAIAVSVLNARGAPLQPPSVLSHTADYPTTADDPERPKPPPRSAFLGVGVIATFFGFSVMLNATGSISYAFGIALGHLLSAGVVALPPFLLWRFFTSGGRMSSIATAFNVYFALLGAVWLVLFGVVPLLLSNYLSGR